MAKRGLGKGLGALIPTEDASSTGNERPPAPTPVQARTNAGESQSHAIGDTCGRTNLRRTNPQRTKVPCTRRSLSTYCQANPRQPCTVFDDVTRGTDLLHLRDWLLQLVVVRRTSTAMS